jgi:hypothetical protein
VFCFFSVCRSKKSLVYDINLEAEGLALFWVLAVSWFWSWLFCCDKLCLFYARNDRLV